MPLAILPLAVMPLAILPLAVMPLAILPLALLIALPAALPPALQAQLPGWNLTQVALTGTVPASRLYHAMANDNRSTRTVLLGATMTSAATSATPLSVMSHQHQHKARDAAAPL